MPGYKPHVTGRAPNSVNAFDDGMEFNLKPTGQNVPQGRADSSYKFFISCFGSDGDQARVSVGQLFRTWPALQKTPCWRQEAAERTAGQRLVEKEGAAHWVARGPWVGLSVALLWGAYSRGTQAVLRRI
jgi:hypothetical protein